MEIMWPRFHYIAHNEWPPGPLRSFGLNGEKAAIQTVGFLYIQLPRHTDQGSKSRCGYTRTRVTLAHGGWQAVLSDAEHRDHSPLWVRFEWPLRPRGRHVKGM